MTDTTPTTPTSPAVWFVTGAARGMGVELVKAALDAGARVVGPARDAAKVTAALGEHDNLLAVSLDITDPVAGQAAVDAAVGRFGRIDTLVNNAGNFYAGYFEEISDTQFRAQMETNFFGPLNVTRAVLPLMRADPGVQKYAMACAKHYALNSMENAPAPARLGAPATRPGPTQPPAAGRTGQLLPERGRVRVRVPRPPVRTGVEPERPGLEMVRPLVAPRRTRRPPRSPLESLGSAPARPWHRRQRLAARPRR